MKKAAVLLLSLWMVQSFALAQDAVPAAGEPGDQYYLVRMTAMKWNPMAEPEEMVPMLEKALAGWKDFIRLQNEGKILAGGAASGEKELVFIVKAKSNEEVSRLVLASPFWGMADVKVTPLESFDQRMKMDREKYEQLKKAEVPAAD